MCCGESAHCLSFLRWCLLRLPRQLRCAVVRYYFENVFTLLSNQLGINSQLPSPTGPLRYQARNLEGSEGSSVTQSPVNDQRRCLRSITRGCWHWEHLPLPTTSLVSRILQDLSKISEPCHAVYSTVEDMNSPKLLPCNTWPCGHVVVGKIRLRAKFLFFCLLYTQCRRYVRKKRPDRKRTLPPSLLASDSMKRANGRKARNVQTLPCCYQRSRFGKRKLPMTSLRECVKAGMFPSTCQRCREDKFHV